MFQRFIYETLVFRPLYVLKFFYSFKYVSVEKGWGIIVVKMPLTYSIIGPQFFERLFERLPHLFPLLRYWLGY
jgi:hypothetical protein